METTMGATTYDLAILAKIKESYSNVIYANTAITYNTVYQLGDNPGKEIKVPLINIYRPSGFELVESQNFAARRQGQYVGLSRLDTLRGRYLTANLTYQFDFYEKTLERLDSVVIQFMQTLNALPILQVTHVDKLTQFEFSEEYELQYKGGPVEQSEFDNNNHVYRYYVQYEIKNARLYDFNEVKTINKVEVDGQVELEVEGK